MDEPISPRKPLYLFIKAGKALSLLHRAYYAPNFISRRAFDSAYEDVVEFLELCNDYKPFDVPDELPDVEDATSDE